jgi:hypothetical protein
MAQKKMSDGKKEEISQVHILNIWIWRRLLYYCSNLSKNTPQLWSTHRKVFPMKNNALPYYRKLAFNL